MIRKYFDKQIFSKSFQSNEICVEQYRISNPFHWNDICVEKIIDDIKRVPAERYLLNKQMFFNKKLGP